MPIHGIRRLDDTTQRLRIVGDNWHTTWAANDRQYVSLCDGTGGPAIAGNTGKNYNTRVLALDGEPERFTFSQLPGFPELLTEQEPGRRHRYYGFGIIAVDGTIFHYLSTPNHDFLEPGARFMGAKLIWSPDHGQTWQNQDGSAVAWESWEQRSRANMVFWDEPNEAFALVTCLQMGRNYEHNRDGFVYLFSPNGNTEGSMNQLVLARVAKNRMLQRQAYQFFVAHTGDGAAEWSSDIEDRGVVHTFPHGWVNQRFHPYAWHPSVVYNAPLGCYMMANWGMAADANGMWFDRPSYLGFWIAPQPWGPWRQIHEETAWMPAGDTAARAYQPQIVPKWIAADGSSLWLAWTDFQELDGQRPYYCYNLQQVELLS